MIARVVGRLGVLGLVLGGAPAVGAQSGAVPPLVGDTTVAWGDPAAAPCVPDVPAALRALGRRGILLGFHMNGAAGLGSLTRHWQGIQRGSGRASRHLFLSRSGADIGFVVVRLESRDTLGFHFRSNRLGASPYATHNPPPETDRIVHLEPPERGFSHAGGLTLVGRVLAVPYDHGPGSRVVFYDVADPEHPRRLYALDHSDVRPPSDPGQAAEVAITRLADGRYLLVLGVHSSKVLDVYVSRGATLTDSATIGWQRVSVKKGGLVRGFQQLALLTQCDGRLFLVGTHNTALPPPNLGHNHAEWYELERGDSAIRFVQRGTGRFVCVRCNFGAGGGLYLDPLRRVYLYAVERGASGPGGSVSVEEFRPAPPPATTIRTAWVELFEDHDFDGRLAVLEPSDTTRTVPLELPEGLGGAVSSVRWSVPSGWRLRLSERAPPGCDGEHYDLTGTGTIPDLRKVGWGDRARCVVWERMPENGRSE